VSAETKEEKVTVEDTEKEGGHVSENKPNTTGKRNLKWIISRHGNMEARENLRQRKT